ncbi:MAG: tRNA (adenosine(37)-N6)-threonylcarbamoyltransferase complex ATPase subunit type 1 TsaE [Rickettsia endosymbiont of Pseudomimeciton antennatum]|nr:tRNA (adenosine(37)-N6)-threonylcarbamoyltransferase complex ATPase subunit type 1 TsaE [Rickettsia endosymbiont of Pseudomimeciton antennatum]
MSELEFDEKQLLLLSRIKNFAKQIEDKSFLRFFNSSLLAKQGIYLYGNVGNGKTALMQHFFQILQIKKLMIHYQNFMQSVHQDIYQLQNKSKSKNNIIKSIATNYAKQAEVICIDEFEIKDITDAMIIGPLLLELIKCKVFIFITSNIKPEDLYKDGLQRNSFLPIIKEIYQRFEVMHLDSDHDYRLDKIRPLRKPAYAEEFEGDASPRTAAYSNVREDSSTASLSKLPAEVEFPKRYIMQMTSRRIIHPINEHNKLEIRQLISKLNNNNRLVPKDIAVFGRKISFKMAGEKILVTDFEELFVRELGYVDYVHICQKFSVIIVENIRIISSDNTDLAVRFINFVDNAYFYKVVLFMTLQDEPVKIYQNGLRGDEFKRTISRLHEMNSDSYVN